MAERTNNSEVLHEPIRQQRARDIARLITANCDAYHSGRIAKSEWDAEQRRLWAEAAHNLIMSPVMRILFP